MRPAHAERLLVCQLLLPKYLPSYWYSACFQRLCKRKTFLEISFLVLFKFYFRFILEDACPHDSTMSLQKTWIDFSLHMVKCKPEIKKLNHTIREGMKFWFQITTFRVRFSTRSPLLISALHCIYITINSLDLRLYSGTNFFTSWNNLT